VLPIVFNGGGVSASLLVIRIGPKLGLGGLPAGMPLIPESTMHMWIGARIIGCLDGAIDPALNAWRRRSTDAQRDAFVRITMRSAARRLQIWWLRCLVRMLLRPWIGGSVAMQLMIEEQQLPTSD